MKKPVKRVAVIHDLCGIGKAALTNVMPVLATLGVEVCPIPTIILTTHTGGFGQPSIVKLDGYLSKAFAHYMEERVEFEGIFVGYLGNTANVEESLNLLKTIDNKSSLIIFDPIFADHGKYYSNFNKNYSDKLKELIKYVHIITPNFTEACFLAEKKLSNEVSSEELLVISRQLHNLGCKDVIITSVPLLDENKIGTSIYDSKNDSVEIIIRDKLKKSYPGTGDIFTSVLIGMLIKGNSLVEAVKKSCRFVEICMIESSKYDYEAREGVLLEAVLGQLNKL